MLHLAPSPSVPCYTGATQQVWALPRLVYLRSLGPMMEHTPPVSCFRQAREAVDKAAADVDAWWSTSRFKRTQFRRSRSRLPARPCPKWLRTGSAATGTVAVMAVALTVALLGLGAVMAAGDVIGAHTIVGRGRSLIAWYCASLTGAVAAWQADHHTPTSVRRSIAKVRASSRRTCS